MRRILLFCFTLLAFSAAFSQSGDRPTIEDLIRIKAKVQALDAKKQSRIDSLKRTAKQSDYWSVFNNHLLLFEEYKAFKYDSAYNYARRLQETARLLNDDHLVSQAQLKLGFSLLSAGLFKEADDSLSVIVVDGLSTEQKQEYFFLMGRLKYDLADFNNDSYYAPLYRRAGGIYIDSAIQLSDKASFEYAYFTGLKDMLSGSKENARLNFNRILRRPDLTQHEIALTASTLSDIYAKRNQTDSAIALLIRAAIADIWSSTKETSAAFNLANLLYRKGDVKNASTCIELAIADATFYGARQRKVKMSEVLPLIETEKIGLVEKQKSILVTYLVIATLLLLGVIVLTVIVLKQVKKLQAAKNIITQAHVKEQEINHRLSDLNTRLSEANKIKEEYIGYFFNVNSEFFDKIERFKNSLEQKVNDRKLDEIRFLVNNINLRVEKEYMLQNFDRVFLKLVPNFVPEFNTLFAPENQVILKEGELLTTDLRIFALIRMGIHENEKIARILQYSVHTINTYKTKIKNRSLVANEEFEKRIMEIRTV